MRFLSLSLAVGRWRSHRPRLAERVHLRGKGEDQDGRARRQRRIDYGRCVIRVFGNGARLVGWAGSAPSLRSG